MNACRVGFVALLVATTPLGREAMGCGLAEMKVFEEKAQVLSKDAENLGLKLLSCTSEARESFQWLSFLAAMGGTIKPIAWQSRPTPKPSNGKGKKAKNELVQAIDTQIDAAYGGSYAGLKANIDSGVPDYIGSFEAQMAIARALIRQGRFSEGRQYFDSALRLGAHDARFDIERVFTFIWERQLPLAEREIGRLSDEGGSSDLLAGLGRAQSLIATLKKSSAKEVSSPATKKDKNKVFGANLTTLQIAQEYRRYSGHLEYHEAFDIIFMHHTISNLVFEQDTNQQDVLWIGRERLDLGIFRIGGKIGYRTPAAENRFLFDAYVGLNLPYESGVTIGAFRANLTEFFPLPRASRDLVQDSLYGKISITRDLIVQSAIARDTNLPTFFRHKLIVDTPLKMFGDRYGKIFGLLGTEYETRERPSPDYETYRQGLRSYAGARIENSSLADSEIKLAIRYQNIHRQGHGMTNWIQNSGLSADLTGSHHLDTKWSLVGRLAYNGEETLRPTQPFQNRLDIRLGAELTQ